MPTMKSVERSTGTRKPHMDNAEQLRVRARVVPAARPGADAARIGPVAPRVGLEAIPDSVAAPVVASPLSVDLALRAKKTTAEIRQAKAQSGKGKGDNALPEGLSAAVTLSNTLTEGIAVQLRSAVPQAQKFQYLQHPAPLAPPFDAGLTLLKNLAQTMPPQIPEYKIVCAAVENAERNGPFKEASPEGLSEHQRTLLVIREYTRMTATLRQVKTAMNARVEALRAGVEPNAAVARALMREHGREAIAGLKSVANEVSKLGESEAPTFTMHSPAFFSADVLMTNVRRFLSPKDPTAQALEAAQAKAKDGWPFALFEWQQGPKLVAVYRHLGRALAKARDEVLGAD